MKGQCQKEGGLLVLQYCLWGVLISHAMMNPRKPCLPQDLHDIRVSPEFISFLLPRSQMTTDEAKACLVQRHANRN